MTHTAGNTLTGAILAGGFGTRLQTVLSNRPKVLAPVGGRPFLTFIMDRLLAAGVRRLVLCTGYLAEQVQEEIGESYRGVPVCYSRETQPLGTGGALRAAALHYGGELWLAANGDSLIGANLAEFLRRHRRVDSRASLLLVRVGDTRRYGTVEIGSSGRITRFREKTGDAKPGWINAGIYALTREFLDQLPATEPLSLERDVFPQWIGRGICGYPVRAPFLDIGTPESFAQADDFVRRLSSRRFVILDRDGTLIREKNYLSDPAAVELLPGAVEGLHRIRDMGLGVVMVTNQSGIGRGYFDEATVEAIHGRMLEMLADRDLSLDGIYICPHTPEDACACRKPGTGLLLQAAEELQFDPRRAFVIGDKACDIDLGRNAGATTILVRTGYGNEHLASGEAKPEYVAEDMVGAAGVIERLLEQVPQ